jgi:phosphonate transport system ATP-binding protein
MAGTAGRLRRVVGEADLHARLVETRSVLWNLLATRRPRLQALGGILRLPRPAERGRALGALARVGLEAAALAPVASLDAVGKARLLVAAALERQPEWLVVRDPDVALGRPDAENLLAWLDRLTARERLTVLVSLGGALPTLGHVEHWLLLCGGRLAFDGPPAAFRTGRLSTAVHGNVHSLSE